MPGTFLFTPPHDTMPAKASILGGNHRPSAMVVIVTIDDHPVVRRTEFVSPRRVGKQGRVMPSATLRMEHRQPRLTRGIETPRRNARQPALRSQAAILPVNVQ
jgi:hypothetical protein